MKNLFFLLLSVFISYCATAQDPSISFNGDSLTFTQRNDAAFAPLEKSRIPHGILYNRVFQFAHLDEIAMDDTLTVMHWIQGVSELERARYGELIPDSFLNPRNVRDFLKSENINRMLPVLVLNEQFSIFDSTAIADGRIDTLNGQYYDGANTGSPYLERQVAFAPMAALIGPAIARCPL